MQLLSQATWLLVASSAVVHAAVQLDLAFPRNQTYAPSPALPIVFAISNPSLAQYLHLQLNVAVWNTADVNHTIKRGYINVDRTGPFEGDLHFAYIATGGLKTEGQWALEWDARWKNCSGVPSDELAILFESNVETRRMHFTTTTREPAPEMNLTTATDNQDCRQEPGVSFDVSSAMEVPESQHWYLGERCAVMGPSTPDAADPCRVQINASAASSIAAAITKRACDHLYLDEPDGIDCHPSAAQQLAVAGVACLTAAIGAVGFIFMV